jgi:ATP-dependent protease ClpP protease subunit
MIKQLCFAISAVFLFTTSTFGKELVIDKDRTVRLTGMVGLSMLPKVSVIENLSQDTTKPIYLLINSPGGSVLWGEVIISSINIAKAKGIPVKCVSTVLAASMAFSIMLACSENYVLANTKLLFHPVRIHANRITIFEENAGILKEALKKINDRLLGILETKLTLSRVLIAKHYKQETLWQGSELAPLFKDDFFQVVDNITGITGLFDLSK